MLHTTHYTRDHVALDEGLVLLGVAPRQHQEILRADEPDELLEPVSARDQ